jgi:hypothetical protein
MWHRQAKRPPPATSDAPDHLLAGLTAPAPPTAPAPRMAPPLRMEAQAPRMEDLAALPLPPRPGRFVRVLQAPASAPARRPLLSGPRDGWLPACALAEANPTLVPQAIPDPTVPPPPERKRLRVTAAILEAAVPDPAFPLGPAGSALAQHLIQDIQMPVNRRSGRVATAHPVECFEHIHAPLAGCQSHGHQRRAFPPSEAVQVHRCFCL